MAEKRISSKGLSFIPACLMLRSNNRLLILSISCSAWVNKDNLEDKQGNPPGILRGGELDPLPPLFKQMIKRMVRWQVLPSSCIPDSCIVNIYDEGDCIPPHIDHHDFLRPFCTVSFLSECNILFGSTLKNIDAGEFSGPVSILLPVGSVLILNGNGADVAKHCVPGVLSKRISITFRRMDEGKTPNNYSPDPDLTGIRPLRNSSSTKSRINTAFTKSGIQAYLSQSSTSFPRIQKRQQNDDDEFPSLASSLRGVNEGKQRQ